MLIADKNSKTRTSHTKLNPGTKILACGTAANVDSIIGIGLIRNCDLSTIGKYRLTIDPFESIKPVPWAYVVDRVPGYEEYMMKEGKQPFPSRLVPIRLPEPFKDDLLLELETASEDVRDFLDRSQKSFRKWIGGLRGARLREERDAVQTALDIAQIQPDPSVVGHRRPVGPTDRQLEGFLVSAAIRRLGENEDDILAADLRRFDPNGLLNAENAAVSKFEGRGSSLTIVSVNRKPLELITGVDLVYWDDINHAFTMIQYKRMTDKSAQSTEKWSYSAKSELDISLNRMESVIPWTINQHLDHSSISSDWRLGSCPFWFKFVRQEPYRGNDEMVVRGFYISADYVSLAMNSGEMNTGPRGGFHITEENSRNLSRATFLELVRKGMIGTSGQQTDAIADLIFSDEERQTVLAIRNRR